MSDQVESGLTEEEVKTYNSALDSFIKLNANYVDFTEKSDGFTYITMRYGLAHDGVLRELALKCKNEIVDNSFVIGQFNWTIVYANSAILRFKCSTNTITTKIENDAKTDEVLFKPTTSSYAENFDKDVAAYVKHYITTNATEPSNVNAELGFSFYKYGNKTHLGIDCATLNKYATSHSDDAVIVALNTVCNNTIAYYTESPKTVTELLSNALAERKLSLEKVNSKVIIFGYNPTEDTGEIETTEILEAWKRTQEGEPEDPNSGNTDPNDPGTGGSGDDPNSGNDPSGSGDDPSQSGDDPSGTQDEFAYQKIPGQITKIIVNYNVLEKNSETGKITFNDTFEPVANDEFIINKIPYHFYESNFYGSGLDIDVDTNALWITDKCKNTYYVCRETDFNADPNAALDDADILLADIKSNSRKITTQQKKILTITNWEDLFGTSTGKSSAEVIFDTIKTNNELKQTLISNFKIYNGLNSADDVNILDNELCRYVRDNMYLGNENGIIYLKAHNKLGDEILNTSYGKDLETALQTDSFTMDYWYDYDNRDQSVETAIRKSMINDLVKRAVNTGTALNIFILDDVDRYFDENFNQNEYELHKQPKINKLVVHFGDITSRTVDKNDFNETTYRVGEMRMPKTTSYENYDMVDGSNEPKPVDLSLLTDDSGIVYSAKTNIFGNDYSLSENLVKLSSSNSVIITVPYDLNLIGPTDDYLLTSHQYWRNNLSGSDGKREFGLDFALSKILTGECGNSDDVSIINLKQQLIAHFAEYYGVTATDISSINSLITRDNVMIASPSGFATIRTPNSDPGYTNPKTSNPWFYEKYDMYYDTFNFNNPYLHINANGDDTADDFYREFDSGNDDIYNLTHCGLTKQRFEKSELFRYTGNRQFDSDPNEYYKTPLYKITEKFTLENTINENILCAATDANEALHVYILPPWAKTDAGFDTSEYGRYLEKNTTLKEPVTKVFDNEEFHYEGTPYNVEVAVLHYSTIEQADDSSLIFNEQYLPVNPDDFSINSSFLKNDYRMGDSTLQFVQYGIVVDDDGTPCGYCGSRRIDNEVIRNDITKIIDANYTPENISPDILSRFRKVTTTNKLVIPIVVPNDSREIWPSTIANSIMERLRATPYNGSSMFRSFIDNWKRSMKYTDIDIDKLDESKLSTLFERNMFFGSSKGNIYFKGSSTGSSDNVPGYSGYDSSRYETDSLVLKDDNKFDNVRIDAIKNTYRFKYLNRNSSGSSLTSLRNDYFNTDYKANYNLIDESDYVGLAPSQIHMNRNIIRTALESGRAIDVFILNDSEKINEIIDDDGYNIYNESQSTNDLIN